MITTFTIRNVANEDGAAQISDFGAHVLSWTPAGGHPAVWQPKAVYLGKPIRGGVPVVLPWFALGFEHGEIAGKKPKHGFARTTVWHVDEDATDDRRIRYTPSARRRDARTARPAAFRGLPAVPCGLRHRSRQGADHDADRHQRRLPSRCAMRPRCTRTSMSAT